MNEIFERAAVDAAMAELERQYAKYKRRGLYAGTSADPSNVLIDGCLDLTAIARVVWNNAIEGCAITAQAWLSIPSNENAQNLPDTLRGWKDRPENG